jgi:hypothetical protein
VLWLVNHRWWALTTAFVLLLVGLLLSRSLGSAVPGVLIVVLFLLFFASLMALVGGRGSPPPPGQTDR